MTSNSSKQKRQLFPEKLWELVNSSQGSGIRWSPSNSKCIEIERSKLEGYLQTKFRSQNFDSFIRQLHFYGFKKCGNSYYHDKFQRDQPDRIHSMRRKYSLNMLNTSSGQSRLSSQKIGSPVKKKLLAIKAPNTPEALDVPDAPLALKGPPANMVPATIKQAKTWNDIKLYTVDSTSDLEIGNFTNVRETDARAIKDGKGHLKISIPKSLVGIADASNKQGPWPRSLVLECYKHGGQNILSAFFLYRLD